MVDGYGAVHERYANPVDRLFIQRERERFAAAADGVVLELGGGSGAHLDAYRPGAVEQVVVLGPDPLATDLLCVRAARAAVPVTVVAGDLPGVAGAPPAELAGGADLIVAVLVLCAVTDVDAHVVAAARLLRPSGAMWFLEHVPPGPTRHRLTAPLWRRLGGGCNLHADLPGALRSSGLIVTELERFRVPSLTLPLRSLARGVASRPEPSR